jgi:hypothetical protein
MTLLELIRMRLNEAEKEPITPSEGMVIDAVDALTDYVECKDGLARGDMRRWCWIAAYATSVATTNIRVQFGPEYRERARVAARDAVADYDAFIAAEKLLTEIAEGDAP